MSRCPSFDVLSRAFSEGNAAMKQHVAACPRCAATWRDLGAVHDAASAPVPPLSDAAAERVAHALWLRTAPSAAVRPAKPIDLRLVAAAVLAVGAVLLWWAPWYPSTPQAARVTPIADADYERSVQYDGERARQEIVRVRRGHLRLEATEGIPLHLLTSDARLEGTAFDVVVVDEHLVELTVRAGTVALYRGDGPPRLLQVGERWTAQTTSTARPPAAPAPPSDREAPGAARRDVAPPRREESPTRASAPPPAPEDGPPAVFDAPPTAENDEPAAAPKEATRPSAVTERPPAEVAFERGWSALRGGALVEAERAFAEVERIAPDAMLAEDAAYWRAVALLRARRGEAREALRRFVTHYPEAERTPEAWVLLGWSELSVSNASAARDAFRRGRDAGGPAVRAEAERGLAATP